MAEYKEKADKLGNNEISAEISDLMKKCSNQSVSPSPFKVRTPQDIDKPESVSPVSDTFIRDENTLIKMPAKARPPPKGKPVPSAEVIALPQRKCPNCGCVQTDINIKICPICGKFLKN